MNRNGSRTYEFVIDLRFRHPSIDPKVITRALRMRPRRAWRAGDSRRTSKGEPLEGTYDGSYWSKPITSRRKWVRATVGSGLVAEKYVVKLLKLLEDHASLLRRIRRDGGSAEIWISSHSVQNYPFIITPETSMSLMRAGITLIIDIYPCRQRGCR